MCVQQEDGTPALLRGWSVDKRGGVAPRMTLDEGFVSQLSTRQKISAGLCALVNRSRNLQTRNAYRRWQRCGSRQRPN
jgi:hypothetical protein